jgi:hypothetical protein
MRRTGKSGIRHRDPLPPDLTDRPLPRQPFSTWVHLSGEDAMTVVIVDAAVPSSSPHVTFSNGSRR